VTILAAAAAWCVPASARERPLRLPDSRLGPVLAGDEAVQGIGSDRSGYRLTGVALGDQLGRVRPLGQVPPGPRGRDYWVSLLASDKMIAFVRTATQRQDPDVHFTTTDPVLSDVWTAPLGKKPTIFDRCRPPNVAQSASAALDGGVLAYVSGCGDRQIRVVSDEPGVGPLTIPARGPYLQVAGRYVAWGETFRAKASVFDRVTGEEVLHEQWPAMPTPDSFVRAWAIQPDGKIGMLYETGIKRGDTSHLAWFSLDEPYLHDVPGEAGERTQTSIASLRMVGDRFAYVAQHDDGCDRLTITALDGRSWPVGCAFFFDDSFIDWNGRWAAWSALTCSSDQRRYAASRRQIEAGMKLLSKPCPIALDGRHQRVTLRPFNQGKLRVRCPRGCNAYLEFRLSRRGRPGPIAATGGAVIQPGRGKAHVGWNLDGAGYRLQKTRRSFVTKVYAEVDSEGDGRSHGDSRFIGRVRIVPRP
jgi:hypothetical protein